MKKIQNTQIGFVTLGCPKNLVDTEFMFGLLRQHGYSGSLDVENCDIVVVNTCAFINDAKKESISAILNLVNQNKKVIVAGCLAQRYSEDLKKEIPEISAYIGSTDFNKIPCAVDEVLKGKKYTFVSETPSYACPENVEREQITAGAATYLKIADGCNFECGYCIIPSIKGKYRSRKLEDIIKEAETLVKKGVREIILIAQDTTSYGIDLYGRPKLAKLLEELNKIKDLSWIRVMYAYPANFNDELIEAYKNLEKVVKYVDIPLQHADLNVLKTMKRPSVDYRPLIEKIRKNIKNVAIRTTFIVGYPAETDTQFENLCEFVREMKFDRLGVFEFSREENTYAYSLKPQISKKIKKERKNKLLSIQNKISSELNSKLSGKKIECIVEAVRNDGLVVARSYKDAPEIDGLVFVKTDKQVLPNDIINVKITRFTDYDLYGVL